MNYHKIDNYIFDCKHCPTPCDGKSKKKYVFKDDVSYAEEHEKKIIERLKAKGYDAIKCNLGGYPDIEIRKEGKIYSYLEVKAQRRTFMSVQRILPNSNLTPSETVALNLSDLLRYFKIYNEKKIPISIVWCLQNRPCIVDDNKTKYFIQNINELRKIYLNNKNSRTFRRKSGAGDVVNGIHKGVVVNYHFSLRELKLWNL